MLILSVVAVVLTAMTLTYFHWQAQNRETQLASEAAPKSGRWVNAGDVQIFIQEAGPADGPVVLFIHGTGAWSETWRQSMKAAGDIGYHAIALDLPPFGYSQRPDSGDYSKAAQARRIIAMLDAMQIKTAILVGHSFGGGPTAETALLAPYLVRGLILVDVALSIQDDDTQTSQSAVMNGLLHISPLRNSIVAAFLTNPNFTRNLLQAFIDDPAAATDERVAIYQRPLSVKGSTEAISAWLPHLLAPPDRSLSETADAYRTMQIPLVAIWGERDMITPVVQGQKLTSLVKGSHMVTLPEVGHIPQLESTVRFNDALLKTLQEFDKENK